ncbi:sigma-70 family RNA polymerase sigma factor [Salinisphaera sp. USBA-960]|nr:sigma-70 family RNA polymerase sigma factor [Salifodinibacter halophilus]NNC27142.1 sigma-70 family RNA polymerase sigma factor [Salifodinibacter halophilus]
MPPACRTSRPNTVVDREQLAEWLVASADGDRIAFEKLYAATSSQLYASVLRILRSPERAQDVLQDAYVRIWQKAGTYAPERGAPLAWLKAVARYRGLDALRRKRPEVPMPEEPDMVARLLEDDQSLSPDEKNENQQSLDVVNKCLQTLQAKQRESVVLAYYQGLTHQELAERMNAPLGTVKSWVRRGLARLQACLAEQTG